MQQQTPSIRTVRETAEVPQRQQLDRVVDVPVLIQPTYSNEVRTGSLEVQVQKGSSDIMKIVIMETTDERPGADVDDGFATTESELAVYSGEAAERRRLSGMASSWRVRVAPPESKPLDQYSPGAVAKPIGEAEHHRIKQYSARTEAELTESTGESGTNTTDATTVTCSGQC